MPGLTQSFGIAGGLVGQVNETAWFYIDRKGPELKSEVCHLVVLWLSENQLTYSLSFLPYKIPKEGIVRIDQDDRCECIYLQTTQKSGKLSTHFSQKWLQEKSKT